MFFVFFLLYNQVNICIHRGNDSDCNGNYTSVIDLNNPVYVNKNIFSQEDTHCKINVFADMNVNNAKERVFDDIIIINNLTFASIQGFGKRRDFAFKILFGFNARLNISTNNLTIYTDSLSIHSKNASYTNTVFKSSNSKVSIDTKYLHTDAFSIESIYELKAQYCYIDTNLMPISSQTLTYIENTEKKFKLWVNNIRSDLIFCIKYHGFCYDFVEYNKKIKFIPKLIEKFYSNSVFSAPNKTIDVRAYWISNTMQISYLHDRIYFHVLENTKFIVQKSQLPTRWFTIVSDKNVALDSLSGKIPFIFDTYNDDVDIFLGDGPKSHSMKYTKGNFTTYNVKSQEKTNFFVYSADMTDSRFIIDKNITATITECNLKNTSFLGEGEYILGSVYTLVPNSTYHFQNTVLKNDLTVYLQYEPNDTTKIIFDDVKVVDKSAKIRINIESSTTTYEVKNIVCVSSLDLIDNICAIPVSEDMLDFVDKVEEKETKYWISFNKIGRVGQRGYFCIGNNKSDLEICPESYNKKLLKDFVATEWVKEIRLIITAELVDEKGNLALLDLENGNDKQTIFISTLEPGIRLNLRKSKAEIMNINQFIVNFNNPNNTLEVGTFTSYYSTINGIDRFIGNEIHLYSDFEYSFTKMEANIISFHEVINSEICARDDFIKIGTVTIPLGSFAPERNTRVFFLVGDTTDINLSIFGRAVSHIKLMSYNPMASLTISSEAVCDGLCEIIWTGPVSIKKATGLIPIRIHLGDQLINTMNVINPYIAEICLTKVLTLYLSSSIYFGKIEVVESGGLILSSSAESNYFVYADELFVDTLHFYRGTVVIPKKVSLSQRSISYLRLFDNTHTELQLNYTYSNIPYIEIEMKPTITGNIVLNNVDLTLDWLGAPSNDFQVDLVCSRTMNERYWTYEMIKQSNSTKEISDSYTVSITQGIYDTSLRCLSLVPKKAKEDDKINLSSWSIALIVIGSTVSLVIIVFVMVKLIGCTKRKIEQKQLSIYRDYYKNFL